MTLSSQKSELDMLKEELFGNPETAISDIKFFPREDGSTATVEEIAAAVRAAIANIRAGGGEDVDLSQ